jgi:hypothetical protein
MRVCMQGSVVDTGATSREIMSSQPREPAMPAMPDDHAYIHETDDVSVHVHMAKIYDSSDHVSASLPTQERGPERCTEDGNVYIASSR